MPHILLAEDEPRLAFVLENMLSDAGFAVTTRSNGAEALAFAEQEPVDLLLTDVLMPEMDGSALFDALRARRPGIPAVVMTGHPDRDDVRASLARLSAAGAVVVLKPFAADALVDIVRTALARAESVGPVVDRAPRGRPARRGERRGAGGVYAVVLAMKGGGGPVTVAGLFGHEVEDMVRELANDGLESEYVSVRILALPGEEDVTDLFRPS
ncbi:response regulator [Arenibaculum pallidiluteum]|uniref:response regulator n=1 Tax=Arenibaculum pallidiluteum TaxID=2812559 RepID=UPI001A9786A8|nr:response regulator [Arenibaculum pallidiluteum]